MERRVGNRLLRVMGRLRKGESPSQPQEQFRLDLEGGDSESQRLLRPLAWHRAREIGKPRQIGKGTEADAGDGGPDLPERQIARILIATRDEGEGNLFHAAVPGSLPGRAAISAKEHQRILFPLEVPAAGGAEHGHEVDAAWRILSQRPVFAGTPGNFGNRALQHCVKQHFVADVKGRVDQAHDFPDEGSRRRRARPRGAVERSR